MHQLQTRRSLQPSTCTYTILVPQLRLLSCSCNLKITQKRLHESRSSFRCARCIHHLKTLETVIQYTFSASFKVECISSKWSCPIPDYYCKIRTGNKLILIFYIIYKATTFQQRLSTPLNTVVSSRECVFKTTMSMHYSEHPNTRFRVKVTVNS